ncbi:MAG: Uma2 family endonuclease [Candidatus Eremiobacteraeota bacterium]|nr:Uma2 family endonuclease [Candidatus Eremiobacteraeota bacterium]MCW5869068.1 Uma2 family endonuclease [Candidatus Eremiobacteraeota bacterium]
MQLPAGQQVTEYLASELGSEVKHEYVGGMVYAMSGARIRHNRIAQAINGALFVRLRGRRCESFNSDMKVRIQLPTHQRFYYPYAMVVCRSNGEKDSFQDEPRVLVEFLSRRTRRLDLGEKREGHLSLSSLGVYLMVEQEEPRILVDRRADQGFQREVYEGLEAERPLAEIYERITFGPEP